MFEEKRVLLCTFKPERLKTTEEMRDWFSSSYLRFAAMPEVEYKCWWVDQEAGEWGAFYVFQSERELRDYVSSETWLKVVPEKYGCTPTWRVLEVGLILSKNIVTSIDSA